MMCNENMLTTYEPTVVLAFGVDVALVAMSCKGIVRRSR